MCWQHPASFPPLKEHRKQTSITVTARDIVVFDIQCAKEQTMTSGLLVVSPKLRPMMTQPWAHAPKLRFSDTNLSYGQRQRKASGHPD